MSGLGKVSRSDLRENLLDIVLPHNNWRPRPHQMRLWQHLQAGGDRAMAVWHRSVPSELEDFIDRHVGPDRQLTLRLAS